MQGSTAEMKRVDQRHQKRGHAHKNHSRLMGGWSQESGPAHQILIWLEDRQTGFRIRRCHIHKGPNTHNLLQHTQPPTHGRHLNVQLSQDAGSQLLTGS